MRNSCKLLVLAVLSAAPLALSTARAAELSCDMKFTMKGWSLIYKTAQGTGTVVCNNGEKMNVALESQGGGLTAGKSKITDGHGEFSGLSSIKDVLGDYAAASGEAAAVKGGEGTLVSKGPVNLALGGTGDGWDVGVAFSKFSIKPAGKSSGAP